MINNSKDIGELINKLETPLGRANAVLAFSKQYQVPEENIKEAITTFEGAYDSDNKPEYSKDRGPLLTAANLARKILWIEKAVDLTAKAGKKNIAAEMAEEFGLNKQALALYKEEGQFHDAIKLAGKLEDWNEYIALCRQSQDYACAINKCKELGRTQEAESIFNEAFKRYLSNYGAFYSILIKIIQETGFAEYAIDQCKQKDKPKLLAQIAAETNQPELAMEYFEKTGQFIEAARQAVLLIAKSENYEEYAEKARKLYLQEVDKYGEKFYSNKLPILKEAAEKTGVRNEDIQNRLFDCYFSMSDTNITEEGAKFFESIECIDKALALWAKAGQLGTARALAERSGLTDKVKEYTQKLGWNENLAEIALSEGNFDQAIMQYNAEIEQKKAGMNYSFAADTALRAAKLCEEHKQGGLAAEFKEQARALYWLETKKAEENGYWDSAAEYAEKAGNAEKAKLYNRIRAITKAYHTP